METFQEEQNRLIARRQSIFARVQRTYDDFKTLQPPDVAKVKLRFERMLLLESDFDNIQLAISDLNAKILTPAQRIDTESVQASFEAIFYGAQASYLNAEKLSHTISENQQVTVTSHVSLPTIELPSFSGDISLWTEYYALFKSLIDEDPSLDNVQKFHYLRSSLKGSALAVISGFQITSANYPLAFKALFTRYQNNRLLASFSIQKIFDFAPLKSPSHSGYQHFLNVHRNSIDALKALELQDMSDFLLFSIVFANLDPVTRKLFENKHSSHTVPTYLSLIEFIEEQSRTMELCGVNLQPSNNTKVPHNKRIHSLFISKDLSTLPVTQITNDSPGRTSSKQPSCPLCKADHTLYRCPTFLKQSTDDKYLTIRKLQRCFNCLGAHMRNQCASKSACLTCHSKQHHTLLHVERVINPPSTSSVDAVPTQGRPSPPVQTLACQIRSEQPVTQTTLLGTVRALIVDAHGQLQPFRAVIDSGSQVCAITHSLVQKLGLRMQPYSSQLSGIGQTTTRAYGMVQCKIASRIDPEIHFRVQALVLPTISSHLPTNLVPLDVHSRLLGLSLADDQFHVPARVDFLIGADLYPDIMQKGGDVIISGYPSAVNTIFGWVLMGPVQSSETTNQPPVSLFTSTADLDSTLRLFWESEEVCPVRHIDPQDHLCENYFLSTHQRDASGRYSVALPFKQSSSPLGSNRQAVLRNYLSLERRLQRKPEHNVAYQKFMHEYLNAQHMQLASTPSNYLIPHHCVHKVTSSSTKLRVVFNASSPDDDGASLNQQLLSGPKLQGDLCSILTVFRVHPVVICADIRQMYRQILVHQSDRAFQHIVWRPHPDSPVLEYELNTVTYGLTSSAFLAQRVLQQLVHDEGENYPLAAIALSSHTYIDDIVSGASSLEEAHALQSQLQALLALGGFELRKWASNVPAALKALPEEHLETPLVFSNEEHGIKILGLIWNPHSDDFSFHTQSFEGPVTKRTILSYIARIFDPLGFLTPFVCWMKVFMQQLWLSSLDWDDPIPESHYKIWQSAITEIPKLSGFRIPRAFPLVSDSCHLVGFCDASEKAFAAVLYLVAQTIDSNFQVTLIRARSKVAPVKPLTIPKLELLAAVLLTQCLRTTLPFLSMLPVDSVTLYTDSQIVLSWITISPHRLKTFVANRVVEILEDTSPSNWAHVSSEENPADCASRGLLPSQLLEHSLWLFGPAFLRTPKGVWPRSTSLHDEKIQVPELKMSTIALVSHVTTDPLLTRFERFSTLLRAQRVFAHAVRFVRILMANHNKTSRPTGPITSSDLQDALNIFVKVTQHHYFAKEIRELSQEGQVPRKLSSLNPFLDSSGFLKVGGRLRLSSLPESARHPLLLPKEAHLSSLICDAFHKSSLHSGPRTVQAMIQQQYWILSLRGLLRKRIQRCLTCYKFRAKPVQPLMADLPVSRVQPSRPFSNVGIDFAGPFTVKSSTRRKAPLSKGYLCLFICMATKAVHLEMTSELSTKCFLACLDRFISRRGLPAHIYSDCGRNFVGAARQLREVVEFLKDSATPVFDSLATRNIQWHFNPPHAPNFGGLWEAGIKSAKSLLHRLISDSSLTFEEYATLFCRIEAVLNSRPLCALSDDPSDSPDYLSPGHFLIGTTLLAPPEHIVSDNPSYLPRWHRVRHLHQAFWSRWSKEYLHTQMQRGKWSRGCPNLRVGDLVYITDAPSNPLSWPLGRVETLHVSSDGVTRVANIRSANGTYTRPVNKLVLIPSSLQ